MVCCGFFSKSFQTKKGTVIYCKCLKVCAFGFRFVVVVKINSFPGLFLGFHLLYMPLAL